MGFWPSLGGEQAWEIGGGEFPGYPLSGGLGPEPILFPILPQTEMEQRKPVAPWVADKGKQECP